MQHLSAHGYGILHSNPPATPVIVKPNKVRALTPKEFAQQFPGQSIYGYAVKVVHAQNTVSSRRFAVTVFVRWDVESGRLMFLTRRFTQTSPEQYRLETSWNST